MLYCNSQLRKIAASKSITQYIAVVVGTIFQWFDFALFSAVSDKLSRTFYPHSLSHSLSILMVWISFAVGWFLAPLGGTVFGYIGDKYGRKIALSLSLTLMSCSSLLIAILPSYHTIGILAPILLLVSRLFQGLSSSAEYNGAAIYLIENASEKLKTFAGCLPNISNSAGMMLGFLAGSIFTRDTLPDWYWRIPFLLSFIGLICTYQLRGKLLKNDDFIQTIKQKTIVSYSKTLKKASLLIILAAYNGVTSWGIYVWLPELLTHYGLSSTQASMIIFIGLGLDIVLEPITGLIAQRISRNKIFSIFSILFIFGLYPCLVLFQQGSFILATLGILLITLLISPPTAMINSIVVTAIDKKIRYLFIGFFWNIGMTILGGTAPAILSFFMHYSGQKSLLLIMSYMSFFVLLGFIAVKIHDRQ